MPHRTNIEWADYSSNPLRAVVGGRRGHMCAKISPGCLHCYSEAMNNRFGNQADYTVNNARTAEHFLDEKELAHCLTFRHKPPYKGDTPRPKVFPFDMTDLFGEWNSDETIDRVMAHFAIRSDVNWLVLTKRADRMHRYFNNWPNGMSRGHHIALRMNWNGTSIADPSAPTSGDRQNGIGPTVVLPLPNLWLGVSAEDQKRADERIPLLLKTPAAVRFVSAEPLLERVDLHDFMFVRDYYGDPDVPGGTHHFSVPRTDYGQPSLDWVIVGGESGHNARPCNASWIRPLVDQCKSAGVPVFVKQLGSEPRPSALITDVSVRFIKDVKGGDPAEWPKDLRVREFPKVSVAK